MGKSYILVIFTLYITRALLIREQHCLFPRHYLQHRQQSSTENNTSKSPILGVQEYVSRSCGRKVGKFGTVSGLTVSHSSSFVSAYFIAFSRHRHRCCGCKNSTTSFGGYRSIVRCNAVSRRDTQCIF